MISDRTSPEIFKRAVSLLDAGQDLDALGAFLELCERFGGSSDPEVRLDLAAAALNIGVILMRDGESSTAIEVFDVVALVYAEAEQYVAPALTNKISLLMSGDSVDEALTACGQLIERFGERSEMWAQSCVAATLSNQAVILIQQGRFEEGCAVFDDFCRRFENSTIDIIQKDLVNVLYNKGVALRDWGKTEKAIEAFTKVVKRVADSDSTDSLRFAAVALYNRGLVQAQIGNYQASVDSAQELANRFRKSDDPVVRERMAKALYHRALILSNNGVIEEAMEGFASIATNFENDQGPVIERVVAAARRRAIFMALLEPAGNAKNNSFIESMFMDLEDDVRRAAPDKIEVFEQNLKLQHDFIDSLVKENADSHQQALSILFKYLNDGIPFGLFLGSFDIEASFRTGSSEGRTVWAAIQVMPRDSVEKQIADNSEIKIPMIAIANNTPMNSLTEGCLPRLELPNDGWQIVVEELIRAAEFVIINVTRLTPGVLRELDIVRRLDKSAQTVVFVSKAGDLAFLPQFLVDSPPPGPQASRESPELETFQLVLYDKSVQTEENPDPDQIRFSAFLSEIERTRQMKSGRMWDDFSL
jgi:tetratricopeptide (TPR) repeat protein